MSEKTVAEKDWTVKDGRSNSSVEFESLVGTIVNLIRSEAHSLICGSTESAARLIMAQLCWKKKNKKWCAQIQVNYNVLYLGIYATELAAAQARETYIAAHPELTARSNFPHGIKDWKVTYP
jgi:hypothetical protein